MTGLYLYDDSRAREFEPFVLTRPLADMVAGAAIQRERWHTALQLPVVGVISAEHLAQFDEGTTTVATGGIPAGSVIANARFVPKLSAIHLPAVGAMPDDYTGMVDLWLSGGRV